MAYQYESGFTHTGRSIYLLCTYTSMVDMLKHSGSSGSYDINNTDSARTVVWDCFLKYLILVCSISHILCQKTHLGSQ